MSLTTAGSYSYTGENANVLVNKPALARPALSRFFKIVEGIKGKQKVHFLNRIEYVTKANTGCGKTATDIALTHTMKTWDPVDTMAFLSFCYTDLKDTHLEWLLATGNDKASLMKAESVQDLLIDLLSDAMFADLTRMAWFANTDLMAGDLTGGSGKLPYFTIFDGFWKKIDDSSTITKVTVGQNDINGDQKLSTGDAYELFASMEEGAPEELLAYDPADRRYLITRSLMHEWQRYNDAKNFDLAYVDMKDGLRAPTFHGTPLIVVDEWGTRLKKDFTIDGKIDAPHRAILTVDDVLQLGFNAQPQNVDTDNPMVIFEDIKDQKWYARNEYAVDTQIADDNLLVAAQ